MIGEIKAYIQTWIRLLKLEAIDTGSSLIAAIVVDLLMALLLLFAWLFLSAALMAVAAKLLHSWWKGSACVAGLYVLFALCVPLLRKPFRNLMIRYLLHKLNTHRNNHGKPNTGQQ